MSEHTSIDGSLIVDPRFVLVDFGGLSLPSVYEYLESMHWNFLFQRDHKFFMLQNYDIEYRVWVVVGKQDLVIFKLKYGNRAAFALTENELEGGLAIAEAEMPGLEPIVTLGWLVKNGFQPDEWRRILRRRTARSASF